MNKNIFTFLFLNLSFLISFAQYPNTDIWLLDVNEDNGTITFNNPVNITNREGYDNQPAFSPDGKCILFSSLRENKQTDIYKYTIASKKTKRFCKTPESEFSPTFMPDGKYISAVLIEKDSTQRLWKFPIKGGSGSIVMDKIDSVGYHCWINENTLAFFILTKPFTLQIADVKTQQATVIADSVSRCIKMIPERKAMSYTVKLNDTTFVIRQHQFQKTPLPSIFDSALLNYKAIGKSEDYIWYNQSTLIMANGSLLYSSCIDCFGNGGSWKLIADLKQFGIDKIGRIAISADKKKIALVTTVENSKK